MLLALASALAIASATGQTAPGAILIDRNRIDRVPPPTAPARPAPAPAAPASVAATGSGTPIAGIRFAGARAPAPVAAAAKTFLGKPATREVLTQLAAALSAAYGKSDVALYTVAIPEQDFSTGVVDVRLTEGRIVAVEVAGAPGKHPLLRRRLQRMAQEQPLSRATFERQMTLIQSVPGLTYSSALREPGGDGGLAMTVTPKQKRVRASAGFSNRGVDLLGTGQFDANVTGYGLATDGDQLAFNASAAPDLRRFRYLAGSYQAPLTASGLTAGLNAGYLETRPRPLPLIGQITGTAKLAGATLSYPWLRDFHHAGDVSLGVDGLDSDNAVFGNTFSRERTRALRAAASWSANQPTTGISFSGSVSHGLDVLGAEVTRPLAETDFLKANLTASIGKQLARRLFGRVTASGQYSGDRLPAAERFSLGGDAIGRAFDTAVLTGDRGAGGVVEIAYQPFTAKKLASSEVYTFVDGGVLAILDRGYGARVDYSLASAGMGFRARYSDKAMLGLEAARSVDDPYNGYPDDWRLSVAWKLSM